MRWLYETFVWLHILAATAWVGGMLFLALVVVPWLRGGERANAGALLSETGRRFRNIGWLCFALLLASGVFSLWMRGVRFTNLTDGLANPFIQVVLVKIGLFATILAVSAWHDFSIGPRAAVAMAANPASAEARSLRRRASWLGRLNVLLALAMVFAGVMLVRGAPWA